MKRSLPYLVTTFAATVIAIPLVLGLRAGTTPLPVPAPEAPSLTATAPVVDSSATSVPVNQALVENLFLPAHLRSTPTPTASPPPAKAEVFAAAAPTRVSPRAPASDLEALICSYPWPCAEALHVASIESHINPYAVNARSGACGIFQHYPCTVVLGDVQHDVDLAYQKWAACGGSFYCGWYAWW